MSRLGWAGQRMSRRDETGHGKQEQSNDHQPALALTAQGQRTAEPGLEYPETAQRHARGYPTGLNTSNHPPAPHAETRFLLT